MVPTAGVKNNISTNDLVYFLKTSRKQYKNLSNKEEREMIEKYSDNEEKLRDLLVMHNIRYVFSLAKKYSKQTVDFDDLIAKGLYGLVIASKKFNLHMPVTKKIQMKDENGNPKFLEVQKTRKSRNGVTTPIYDRKTGNPVMKMIPEMKEVIQYESDGLTPKYVKFNTYATLWILKYMRKEFNDENEITTNTKIMSLNKAVTDSKSQSSEKCTMENFLNDMMAPDVEPSKTDNSLSTNAVSEMCKTICDYVEHSPELSSTDRKIFFESFYGDKKNCDIANMIGIKSSVLSSRRKKIMENIRTMLKDKFGITSKDDILIKI